MKGGSHGQTDNTRIPARRPGSLKAGGFTIPASQRWIKPVASQSGFTIIEILIVLAVTASLFIMAVVLIAGRQNVAAYNQAIHGVQTQLQQVVGEVASGFYPNNGNITCNTGGPGGKPLITAAPTPQGENSNCIFLGKVMQFAMQGSDPEEFNVYTIAGLRGNSANPSTDLTTAKARLIAKGTGDTGPAVPDVFDVKRLLYGLTVADMYYDDNPANDIGAVGFTSSLKSLGSADTSQQVSVVAVLFTHTGDSKSDGVRDINHSLEYADTDVIVNPPGGVQICFNSGGTQQSGKISIGGAGRQDFIELQIYNKLDCAP